MWILHRIDSILISTVSIMEGLECKRQCRLDNLLAKLTNGKSLEYYARYIKNLAIFGPFAKTSIGYWPSAVTSGVENLVLLGPAWDFDLFKNTQTGRHLRRLTVNLSHFKFKCSPQLGSMPGIYHPSFSNPMPNFYHPCFSNLTHLHLMDDDGDWPTYTGWETLASLTHLAFTCYALWLVKGVTPTVEAVTSWFKQSKNGQSKNTTRTDAIITANAAV